MRMIRYNPYRVFNPIAREMERMMMNHTPRRFRSSEIERKFQPAIDITEDEKGIRFFVEIAGIPKEDITISVSNENILTIKGEKKKDATSDEACSCRNERKYGEFTRSFQLPEDADSDKIEAEYKNGLLELSVPKLEPVKPKELEIAIN